MRVLVLAVTIMLAAGCATVEMPLDSAIDGQVMKFRGFASDMTIIVPATETIPERTITISAHATEGPVLEALKSIAPFVALGLGQ